MSKLRRLFKIAASLLAIFLLIFALLLFILNMPVTQCWLTPKVENWLETKLQTHVEVKSIGVRFPKSLEINGLKIDTRNGDTLLQVGSLVVDADMWQLFHNQLSIKKVGLEDAVVKINRQDERFNFGFILDAFAPPEQKSTPPPTDTSSSFQVVLRPFVFNLKNVSLDWQDIDNQQFINARIGQSSINVEDADLKSVQFSIQKLELEDADISVRQLSIEPPDSTSSPTIFDFLVKNAAISKTRFLFEDNKLLFKTNLDEAAFNDLRVRSSASGIAVVSEDVELQKTDLIYLDKSTIPTPDRFNPIDLDLASLNASIHQFSYQNDSIRVKVDKLSGKEKSGVKVEQLHGNLQYSPGVVNVQGLDFQGNTTRLNGSITMNLGEKPAPPISNFTVELQQSEGTVADIIRFLPPDPSFDFLEKMADQNWTANGKVAGTMKQMETDGFQFAFGKNSRLQVSGNAANLDTPNKLSADLKLSEFRFDKNDLSPFLKEKNWQVPAFAKASGTVKGQNGLLSLNLSGIFGNLDNLAKAPSRLDTAKFNVVGQVKGLGNTKTMELDLNLKQLELPGSMAAAYLPPDISAPENISVSGTASGTLRKLNTDLNMALERAGQITQLNGKGTLENLTSTDSLRLDMTIAGEVAKAEIYGYVPDSLIAPYVNLPDKLALEGTVRGLLNDLRATAKIGFGNLGFLQLDGFKKGEKYAVNLKGNQLKINELAADSLLPQLRLADFMFHLEGQGFDVGKSATASLTGAFQTFTWEGFTMNNIGLEGNLAGKKFNVKLNNPDPRLHLNLQANGELGGAQPSLIWDAVFDCLDLDALGFSEKNTSACFHLSGNATGLSSDSLEATVLLQDIDVQYESQHVKPGDVQLRASLLNRKNDLTITSDWLNAWLRGQFDPAGLPDLIADFSQHYFKTNQEQPQTLQHESGDSLAFELTLKEPDFFTTGIVPNLYEMEELKIAGNLDARSHRFTFTSNLPRATYDVWTVESLLLNAKGDGKTADFKLEIPKLDQYGEAFVSNLSMSGTLDGKTANVLLAALDSLGKERFKIGLFAETDDFQDGYTVHFSSNQIIDYKPWTVPADNSLSLVGKTVSAKNLHFANDQQAFRLDGSTKPTANGEQALDFVLDMQRVNLAAFEVLMAGSLKNLAGWTSGNLKIGGTTNAPKPSGSLQLKAAQATVVLTNVRYLLSDQELVLKPNGLDLTGLTITDPQGNLLTINGMLETQNWKDIQYNLVVSSKKWLVLNTKKGQNPLYYGKVIASANGTVRGPLAEPIVTISVKPLEGSTFNYIYDPAQEQATVEGVVVFVKPVEQKKPRRKAVSKQYPLQLNLNLEIDDKLQLNVVTDPGSGDFFEGTLEGRIALEIYPDGTINLAGRAEVKQGQYRYSYQNIVKRRFEVAPDSYLSWSGDPFNPDLQITARYVVRTSPAPLLALNGVGQNDGSDPTLNNYQTFFLNFKVTNNLASPGLKIDIEYPDNQAVTQGGSVNNSDNSTVQSAVTSLNNDDVQLSQQVFGLLVFNAFIGGGVQLENASVGLGLNDFLTSQFNALAGQYIKFVDVSLQVKEDVTFNSDNQATGSTNYNLSLQKSFLNNRLTFKVSGGAEEDRSTGSQWSSSLENALVEYSITPNGGLKIRAFSENGLELLNSDVIRNSGAGLVFTKEFKSLRKKDKE
ncbi:MAG: translocation/assembly module TamB domain-containing protein [Saprospiraceae bacterium]|nr:translocation/assembly module TamB domain-containing protein [Saprospiraceae bacterium]MCF8249219.1 translocation/assembly module TamB domain-containing protein [Saprospiraceae bacterium]MCF8280174.1 translocation/assembly module TamB domain-containing protein [Bacteroidales bacterium]MCF8311348.1 translocation/assembly module TamB domain-containing protein [Saprospiraceae bacterium]MCF8440088.1 translocation/assembly module TamB domain-containing protein [Saprospiraceae bacterium]